MPKYDYEKGEELGRGQFGVVHRAVIITTGVVVAVKKLIKGTSRKEGIETATLREIMLLQELKHENIIDMIEVYCHNGSISLVLELCLTDLEIIIKDRSVRLSAAQVKGYMLGTMNGVAFCHENSVLHRDLKPGNVFLTTKGVVKVGDFGLARSYGSPERKYTGGVVTPWYRAPELLFGAKFYGTAVDLWSIGCIFAELLNREPLLPGNSDIEQLSRIFTARGTPTDQTWPGVASLPDYIRFQDQPGTKLSELCPTGTASELHLLNGLLTLCPGQRITAPTALEHIYFREAPLPAEPAELIPVRPDKPR